MKKISKRLYTVVLIIAVILTSFAGFVTFSYAAEQSMTINIAKSKEQYGYDSSGERYFPNMYNLFTTTTTGVYGGAVYCAEHDRSATTGNRTGYIFTDSVIRKIMYYGYRGPAEWSGFSSNSINGKYQVWGPNTNRHEICGTVVTSQALSNRYNALGGKGTACSPAGLTEFMSYINSMPAPESNYTVYKVSTGNSTQDMMFARYEPQGSLKLKKTIANNDTLVKLCPENYSLSGAEYGIYKSTTLSGSSKVGTLITDDSGNTNILTLNAGTYYVKETKAPKGFDIDTKVYTVTVVSGNTATINCSDVPLFDPLSLIVQKKATAGTENNLSVEGAEYTVKYYKQYLNTETEVNAATPFRTWVFRTDSNGVIQIADIYKVGGDELFKNENGITVGLFGTYTFEETKAPAGFAKTEGLISIQQIKEDSGADQIVVLKDVIDIEKPQTVSITVQKVDAETGQTVPQGHGTFAGAEYTVTQYNELTDKEETIGTITLDESGKGTLDNLKPGVYAVEETKAPTGYLLNDEVIEVKAGIKELNIANFEYLVESKETPTTTVINKYEVVGEEEVGIAGAKLQILDTNGDVVEEFFTDGQKNEIKGLPPGKYILHEAKAPEGNLMASDIEFEIKEGEFLTEVSMEDEYTKVQISKTDITTGKEIPGAKLQIVDKDGKVVEEWTSTDKPHTIERLEPGEYTLHEESAPAGYLVAGDIDFTVAATGKIQKVEMQEPIIPPETGDINGIRLVRVVVAVGLGLTLILAIRCRGEKEKGDKNNEL
ncbi:MAG: SpaA isopeptide-forming pilin-related protein [Anaerovoracaceae bacterium]